jgi:hypothetical protein
VAAAARTRPFELFGSVFFQSVASLVVSSFTQGHIESAVPKHSKNGEMGANGPFHRP